MLTGNVANYNFGGLFMLKDIIAHSAYSAAALLQNASTQSKSGVQSGLLSQRLCRVSNAESNREGKVEEPVPGCLDIYTGLCDKGQLVIQVNLHPPSQCPVASVVQHPY